MVRSNWSVLQTEAPELAEYGRQRLDGKVAYLATIRADGYPRAHPVTPIIGGGHCFIFMEPSSPKAHDLVENGRYCMHCSMSDSSGSSGEFQVSGLAVLIEDKALRQMAEDYSIFRPASRFLLFELDVLEAKSKSYRGSTPNRRQWPEAET